MPEICVLVRPKLNFLGWHWGLLLANGMVFENTAEHGPRVVTYEEFAMGMPVRVERRVPLTDFIDTNWRVQQELLNRPPYRVLQNNCETSVNRVTGHGSVSKQVEVSLLAAALVGVVAVAAAANS